jgi:hypothetical protein
LTFLFIAFGAYSLKVIGQKLHFHLDKKNSKTLWLDRSDKNLIFWEHWSFLKCILEFFLDNAWKVWSSHFKKSIFFSKTEQHQNAPKRNVSLTKSKERSTEDLSKADHPETPENPDEIISAATFTGPADMPDLVRLQSRQLIIELLKWPNLNKMCAWYN